MHGICFLPAVLEWIFWSGGLGLTPIPDTFTFDKDQQGARKGLQLIDKTLDLTSANTRNLLV